MKRKKRILVIAASGGIGLAISKKLIEQNHILFLTTRSIHSDPGEHLKSISENKAELFELDLTNETDISVLFESIKTKTSWLDLIINCSGLLYDETLQPEKRIEDLEYKKLQRNFMINSIAPVMIAKFSLPLFRHDQLNIFANISARVGSISDNRLGGWYSYRMSKAAQNMATKTLSIELKRRRPNTIVVGLHPGTVDTRLSKPFQGNVKKQHLKTADEAANNLLNVISNLSLEHTGKVFAWDGQEIQP